MRAGISRRALVGSAVAALAVQRGWSAQDATPEASPVATPAIEGYPPISDVRDIRTRPWSLEGTKFSIQGVVTYLEIAREGEGIELGDDEAYKELFRTDMIIKYDLPNGDVDWITVGAHFDPAGVYVGDTVTIGGELIGTVTSDNGFGSTFVWPLMVADYIRLA